MNTHEGSPASMGGMPMLSRSSWVTIEKETQQSQFIVNNLSVDELAIILSFLDHNEMMHARVCTTWRDAAKKALVPSQFRVKSVRSYNALRAICPALPNLQQLSICHLGKGNKYADGEDPHLDLAARKANHTTHDLNIISNFRKLHVLDINDFGSNGRSCTSLNGRYPVIFNFPMLQSLKLSCCPYLWWDFDMLSGCPLLRELRLNNQSRSTGDLKSLRVLKNTLETVEIMYCYNIHGNFMDLTDFPCLKELWICGCPVIGDIRDIQQDDFSSLERLRLPSTVIGGDGYQFQRISDVPSFMHAIHPLLKRFPETFNYESRNTHWRLSDGSDDWYGARVTFFHGHPFSVDCVLAEGLRCGWRWSRYSLDLGSFSWQPSACEVNWLDPEPSQDSDDYEKYVACMQRIEDETGLFRGYYEPPTEEEYRRLRLRERRD